MNLTTPYNTTDYFFTKEQDEIVFQSPLQNTYFELKVDINTFDFYTEKQSAKTLVYKIPLYQNKATFILGSIVDRSMQRMKSLNLANLFQYKPALVNLTITEKDIDTDAVITSNTIGQIQFVAGYKPEIVVDNCAFLDLYSLSRSVTEQGAFFLNILVTSGQHLFKVLKNNVEVDSFQINSISNCIASKLIYINKYDAVKGDNFKVYLDTKPTITKSFAVLPNTLYSNYIAFEDEFNLRNIVEFRGEYKFSADFISKINKVQKGDVEFSNKVSSKTDLSLIINTGFILADEESIIESLLGSLKSWLITSTQSGIELVPTTKKISKQDPTTELYSYDIEFIVNVLNARPLLLQMNSSIPIILPDLTPPTTPLNLINEIITTNSVKLSWEDSIDTFGVIAYDVFKNGDYIGSTPNIYFYVYGLTPSTTYTFTVSARDAENNISTQASILTTTYATVDTEAPTSPLGLYAAAITTNSLTLNWTASTDNVAVVKYNVYKNAVKIGETSSLTFNITGLTPASTNNFYVRAQDAAGNISIPSVAINETTTGITLKSFYMAFNGNFVVDRACIVINDSTNRFHNGASYFPTEGDIIYTDFFGTNVLEGFDKCYGMSNNNWIQINEFGEVILSGTC